MLISTYSFLKAPVYNFFAMDQTKPGLNPMKLSLSCAYLSEATTQITKLPMVPVRFNLGGHVKGFYDPLRVSYFYLTFLFIEKD